MAKKCLVNTCNSLQFGGGYCAYHQYFRRKQGGDLFKRKAPVKKPIPRESKKRKAEHIRYIDQHKMFIQENKEKGTYYCFMCLGEFDDTIDRFCTVHHLHGRTGDYYTDKKHFLLAHNKCHLDVFDRMTIAQLKQYPWWDDFCTRLKQRDEIAWLKIQNRVNKSQKDLFLSED